MERRNKALALFDNGYSCAQAILIAFADAGGIEEKTAFRIAAGLGVELAEPKTFAVPLMLAPLC